MRRKELQQYVWHLYTLLLSLYICLHGILKKRGQINWCIGLDVFNDKTENSNQKCLSHEDKFQEDII